MAVDYYQILNVTRQASGAEVRAAYLRLAQESHPDRNGDGTNGGENRFKQIQRAYEVLGDPAKRAEYDRSPKAFQRSGPVQYRRGPASSGTSQRPPVGPSADVYTRRDIPNAWLLRRKRSKASWLRTAIWLVLMALCLWGCARIVLLVIPATLAVDGVLPGDAIENGRTAEEVVQHGVQHGGPLASEVEALNSALDSIVVPSPAESDETEADSQSDDLAISSGQQQDEIHDAGSGDPPSPERASSPELAFDGFSYPNQTEFDAVLIDIDATFPPPTAAVPWELLSSMEVPLSPQPPQDIQDIGGPNQFDFRFRRPALNVPTTGSSMSIPSWTSSNWYERDANRSAGGEPYDGAAPPVSANRPYQHFGFGDPVVGTPRTGPGGRRLSSPILGSPYGVQPHTENHGGTAGPYGDLRERLSPRSMGAPRWPVGSDGIGSAAGGPVPSSPYAPAYPSSPGYLSSPTYPSAGASMSSPYSPYSNDGGLYGPDR